MSKYNKFLCRGGFTSIELIIVIGILATIALIATPTILDSSRRAAVNQAGQKLMDAWATARSLALNHHLPLTGTHHKHYGIAITSNDSGQTEVTIIYDQVAQQPAAYGEENSTPLNEGYGTVVSVTSPNGAETSSNFEYIIYAQYGTGYPLSAQSVANKDGKFALPIGFGTDSSPLAQKLTIHTRDWDEQELVGFAQHFQIHEVAIACLADL